ncbi:amino acid adenylation domain-containing protein [Streptomyces sp. NPDC047023]|uniref:amino acid adenylation domain-containing protein n=1 Tax=Streptomyces sp. NPDC047023 TaxID=3155139 RepID=UPI0033FD927B
MTDSARLDRARRLLAARRPDDAARTAGAVTARPADAPLVLSESQSRLWTAHRLDPTGAAYTVPAALDITGPLDRAALGRAYDWLLARHEGLGLQVEEVQGRPVPRRAERLPGLRHVDLSALPAAEAARRRDELTEEQLRTPFDMTGGGPLVRGCLLRLGDGHHRLVVAFQHLLVDGVSVGILLRELTEAYEAISTGADLPGPAGGPSYADYAWWEHERRTRPGAAAGDGAAEYWSRTLEGAPHGLGLPLDRPRPEVRAHRGGHLVRVTDAALRGRAEKFAADSGTSVFAVLYAAWRAVLHRAASTDDLVIGVPVADRTRPELRGLVGPLLSTLPLRSRLRADATLRDLVADSARAVADALDHQHLPGAPAAEGNTGRPLYGAMFNHLGEDRSELGIGDAVMRPVAVETATSKADVTLSVAGRGDVFELMLEYDTEILSETSATGLLEAYTCLLAAGLRAPARPVRLLPLTATAPAVRAAARPLVPGALDAGFRRAAEQYPHHTALHWKGLGIPYRELAERAETLARHLIACGVRPGDRVPLLLDRGPAQVVGVLAVLLAGATYVPLDPRHPAERIRYVIEDSGSTLLVTGAEGSEAIHGGLRQVTVDDRGLPLTAVTATPGAPLPARHPDDTAYVIYTSGSTGRPKGVEVADAQVVRLFTTTADDFGFGPQDVWTFFHSFAFDFSVWELWGALLHGGTLVVVPEETTASPADLLDLLERLGVTVLNQTPSAFKGLVAADAAEGHTRALALRHVVFGGESLEVNSLRPWIEARGDRAPRLVNMYGITETTVHTTHRVLTAADLGDRVGSPIGVPLDDVTLHVLDDALAPLPVGMAGELYVGGAGVATGYAGRGGLTAERFVPDPFTAVPGARLYRSGDLARRREDGAFDFLGRADAQVKVRGHRIELGEVEAALAAHPAVAAAVADVREGRLVAWLVPAGSELPALPELRDSAAAHLPPYMVPAVFVRLAALPLTVNGKADRRALPDPADGRIEAGGTRVAARTGLEELVCEVWRTVLGLRELGVHDNFFAAGGDSIRAVEISGRLRSAGYDTTVHAVFRHQTVAELAAHLGDAESGAAATAEPFELVDDHDRAALPEDAEDAYPLTSTQAGMLYHLHMNPEAGIYHNTVSVRMRGRLHEDALWQALADTIARHPVLRTDISMNGYSEPLQIVRRTAEPRLAVTDLSGLGPDEQRTRIDAFVAEERSRHLDIEAAPLYRMAVHTLGEDEFQLTISENHAILDGWSWTSTVAEVFGRQDALLSGDPAYDERWPEVPSRYADFVKLERTLSGNPDTARVWRDRLADAEPRSAADLRPAGMPQVRRLKVDVDPTTSQRLAALARADGLPLKSLAIAVHLKVLSAALAVSHPVTGMVLHGRPDQPGAKDVRGLFINMLPTTLAVPGGTWRDLARRMFEEERTLLEQRHTPLVTVQQAMGNEPLFDVGVNFVRFHALGEVLDSGVVELVDHHPASAEDTNYAVMATYSVHPPEHELGLMLAYDADRVSDERAAELATMYARALRLFAAGPDAPHDAESLLPDDAATVARRALGANLDVPEGTLHGAVASAAAARPDAVAVTAPDGSLTYRELVARSRRTAAALVRAGVRRGDLVAVVARRGTGLVTGILAAMEAGAGYVPVDPDLPPDRIGHLLRDSACTTALTAHLTDEDGAVLALLADEGITVRSADEDRPDTEHQGPDQPDPEQTGRPAPGGAGGDDLAYVIYTSGSTGTPKGVAVTHRNVLAYLAASATVIAPEPDDVVAVRSTFSFDLSVWELFAGLVAGARIHLVPADAAADPQMLHEHLREHRVSMLATTPTIAQELAAVDGTRRTGMGLRALLLAGEEVVPARFADWFDGPSARDCTVLNWYGPTEATVLMTAAPLTAEVTRRQRAPIGGPVPGSSVWLLDESMRPVAPGAAGEIHIGGAQVAQGYWRRPALTAERFVPDPFSGRPGARLYRTGDRARHRGDGQLEFLGRSDGQIKLRGHRIELGEVEAALLEHPSVTDVAVVVRDADGPAPRLVAYVVTDEDGLDVREVRNRAAGRLPRHALPAAVRVVEAIPHTPSGKLDRRALPAPSAGDHLGAGAAAEGPRDETEERLLAAWQELLSLDGLGIRDHFYEAGGHSLLATRLLLRVQKEFGVQLRIQDAMADFTVAGLAARVRAAGEGTTR